MNRALWMICHPFQTYGGWRYRRTFGAKAFRRRDAELWAYYADPANRQAGGPGRRRRLPCACSPRCDQKANPSEESPQLDDYCQDCTDWRCDAFPGQHARIDA